jgi:hypothetical protein
MLWLLDLFGLDRPGRLDSANSLACEFSDFRFLVERAFLRLEVVCKSRSPKLQEGRLHTISPSVARS